MIEKKRLCLYAVTDRSWLSGRTLEQCVEQALQGGVSMVQLREKLLSGEDFLRSAERIKRICDAYQTPLIINDDVEIALKTDAAGVHVGQQDMAVSKARRMLGEKKIIGASARTVEQALKAEKEGADYLGVGAVFGTNTKKDAKSINLSLLQEICSAVRIPVAAIGGVTLENMMELKGTGVSGAAVVSAVFDNEDIVAAVKELRKKAECI